MLKPVTIVFLAIVVLLPISCLISGKSGDGRSAMLEAEGRERAEALRIQTEQRKLAHLAALRQDCPRDRDSMLRASGKASEPGDMRAAASQLVECGAALGDAKLEARARELSTKADALDRQRHALEGQRDLARRRKEGVGLGMTADQVEQSSWGRPAKINRTTTVRGVREQWVYPSGGYLYFDDGVLTAIQN